MKSKIISYIFLFILLCSFIYAVAPVTTIIQEAPEENLILIHPLNDAYAINTVIDFHLAVFNRTGHRITNASTNGVDFCTMIVFDKDNKKIFDQNLTYDGEEWEHNFTTTQFTEVNEYPYLIWCEGYNTKTGAGVISSTLLFTNTGVTIEEAELKLTLTLNLLFIVLMYLAIGLTWDFNITGKVEQKINAIKLFLIWLLILLIPLVANYGLENALIYNSSDNIISMFETLYQVTIWVAWFISIYFMIYFIYNTMLWLSNTTGRKK